MWSAAVLDPALPVRRIPANASPPATSGRSRKHNNGWKPNVCFHVGAASSFSECAIVIVASKSRHSADPGFGAAPAAHARSRAVARADRTRPRCAASIRFNSRHVVGIDATGPNRSFRSPSTAIPLTAVRTISDRARQIGEHPTRGMHRHRPCTCPAARRVIPATARELGQLPQQPDPRVGHHTPAIRADLDPPNPTACYASPAKCLSSADPELLGTPSFAHRTGTFAHLHPEPDGHFRAFRPRDTASTVKHPG